MVPTCDQYATLDSQVAAPAVDPLFKRKRKGKDKELEFYKHLVIRFHLIRGRVSSNVYQTKTKSEVKNILQSQLVWSQPEERVVGD